MILESLFDLVNDLKLRISEHGSQLRSNEMQTRYALIDPLLRELGWDTSDPSQVTPEYVVGSGRVDYALLRNGRPVLMVEAKKLGEDLKGAVLQGVSYAWQQGASHFAVTDGQRWHIYDIRSGGGGQEPKPQVSFDITQSATGAVCLEALALWQPSVLDGSVRRGRNPVEGTPGTPAQGPESVRVVTPALTVTSSDTTSRSASEWQPLDRSSLKLDGTGHHAQPVELAFPDGSSIPVRYWWEITASVTGWLIDNGRLTAADCPISLGRARRYIISASPVHSTGSAMKQPKRVKALYMEANYSAASHVDNARAVVQKVGQDPSQFKLRFP